MAYEIESDGKKIEIEIEPAETEGIFNVRIGDQKFHVDGIPTGEGSYSILIDGQSYEIDIDVREDRYRVVVNGEFYELDLRDERRRRPTVTAVLETPSGAQLVSAPMAGKVLDILVVAGQSVEKDQGVMVIEAMKMENELRSPIQGVVKEVYVKRGEAVEPKAKLLLVEGS
ncbi:MAG: acetyl-CoA carboxylase biotin carboxyl carrier protein subunit [Deltaproteobacteria bacterium]|nr:acetyl-CoA carboxylase biotin carboxyl carrier protein subunit [Deltaproteobacteria bacterium]